MGSSVWTWRARITLTSPKPTKGRPGPSRGRRLRSPRWREMLAGAPPECPEIRAASEIQCRGRSSNGWRRRQTRRDSRGWAKLENLLGTFTRRNQNIYSPESEKWGRRTEDKTCFHSAKFINILFYI